MLGILATEAAEHHLDLVGKLRGYAIVVFAVGLFCGSIYLLLATDIGNRMGFLVSFASLTGFLAMLGIIWFTSLTPLNALHGPAPHWKVTEIVDDLSEAETEKVRNIEEEGVPLDTASQGEIKATVDTAVTEAEGEFQLFVSATDYVVVGAERIGGGSLPFFRHRPLHAVMQIQAAKKVDPLPGAAPPPPAPDPEQPVKHVVMVRDLGALRQPPVVMTLAFGILFALTLYVMHQLEREEQKAKTADLEPAPVPA